MGFSWRNFDPAFLYSVLMLSPVASEKEKLIGFAYRQDDIDALAGMMSEVCPYPNQKFVMKYRRSIEDDLLRFNKAVAAKLYTNLGVKGENSEQMRTTLAKKTMSASAIQAYIGVLLEIGGADIQLSAFDKFKSTVSVNMRETATTEVPLYDFQKEASAKLKSFFIDRDRPNGLMVMPTGSGKSRTAITFLIREMVARGYQVLWIAHRHMLLDQAADCFYQFAGLAKINRPDIRNYRISCISGEHLSIKEVDRPEIIVASINSIWRSKDHLRRVLGKKVMIVVDEAHHTLAPTYQDTIRFIRKCRKGTKLLGITATPVRGSEKDSQQLLRLYDDQIVYEVSMATLIAQGILAEPIFKRIETGEDFEPEITLNEAKLIKRYGELPETLVTKIARSNARNQMIIEEYVQNKEQFGKTLIFAMNVIHCRFLHEELTRRGVKCGLVYSGKEDNAAVINSFRSGDINVLVNVNIMTEGSDVPDIQTVFLTRPTGSEGLLMQMIGRGMRGVHAGGTESVNIIDFHDKWEAFNRWLNPEWVISDEPLEELEIVPKKPRFYIEYEWALCREIYNSICFKAAEYGAAVSVPAGWYTLIDEDGELVRMLVFEDQLDGIKALMADKKGWLEDRGLTAEAAINRYFGGFCTRPSVRDMELLMDNVRTLEEPPQIHAFKNRKSIDPCCVARQARGSGLDIVTLAGNIYDDNDVARDLYPEREQYIMKVVHEFVYQGKRTVLGAKVEELPEELIPFDRTPAYDLPELVDEVKDMMFGGHFDGISSVRWTDKAYRTYYGVHYHDDHSIRINCVLNSKDVPRDVVRFVVYHELLHRDYPRHDKQFREKEHEYPHYEECEHFLMDNMKRFDIVEW